MKIKADDGFTTIEIEDKAGDTRLFRLDIVETLTESENLRETHKEKPYGEQMALFRSLLAGWQETESDRDLINSLSLGAIKSILDYLYEEFENLKKKDTPTTADTSPD